MGRLKELFEHDFNHKKSPDFPKTVADAIKRIAKWKRALSLFFDNKKKITRLETFRAGQDRRLVDFRQTAMEIPGQYDGMKQPSPEQHVRLDRIDPQVKTFRRAARIYRELRFIGTDGKVYCFITKNSLSPVKRTEDRMLHVMTSINRIMNKFKETRKRNLQLVTPTVVHITSYVRLISMDSSYVSFHDILDADCAERGKSADDLLVELVSKQSSSPYEDMRKAIGDKVFVKYFTLRLPSPAALFVVRQQFTQQLALHSLLNYAFLFIDRLPEHIFVSRSSGTIVSQEIALGLDSAGVLGEKEIVPFRLTPNLKRFITSIGLEGPFKGVFGSAAAALVRPQAHFFNVVMLLMLDELNALQVRELEKKNAAQVKMERELLPTAKDFETPMPSVRERASANTDVVRARLAAIAPKATQPAKTPQHPVSIVVVVLKNVRG